LHYKLIIFFGDQKNYDEIELEIHYNKMFRWTPYPFVRITLAAIAGILLWEYFPIKPEFLFFIGIASFFVFLAFRFKVRNDQHHHFSAFFGFNGLFVLCIFMLIRSYLASTEVDKSSLIHLADSAKYITGKIIADPEMTDKTQRYIFKVSAVNTNNTWQNASGKIHLYIYKNDEANFQPGDQLIIKSTPSTIAPPRNPEQFNYKKYLARKSIHHQIFAKHNAIVKTGNSLFFIKKWARNIRKYALKHIRKIEDPAAQGVIEGLLLGSKDNIDNVTRSAYTAAGLMHILAVSGLHVSIIYFMMRIFFGHIKKFRHGQVYFTLLCISILWMYALITGLSPSVCRASFMFSLVAIADASRRQKNIYNTLAASAFFLLLINPNLLFSVSFQLSYIAVLGIVYLQPRFENLWPLKNIVVKRIWQLFTVGMAAQIATLPISVYYFNQIPVLSVMVGILAIPLASSSFALGLFYLLVAQIPWLNQFLRFLLEKNVQLINWLAIEVESLSFSLIKNVYLDAFQVILIYAVLVSLLAFIYYKKFQLSVILFSLLLCFNLYSLMVNVNQKQDKSLIVFAVPNESVAQFNLHGEGYLINNKNKIREKDYRFYLHPFNLKNNIKPNNQLKLAHHKQSEFSIFYVCDKRIAIINKLPANKFKSPQQVDVLIVSSGAIKSLQDLQAYFLAREIILDSSNPPWLSDKLYQEGLIEGIAVYPVNNLGAKIIYL
jgi:competence protein ComEC